MGGRFYSWESYERKKGCGGHIVWDSGGLEEAGDVYFWVTSPFKLLISSIFKIKPKLRNKNRDTPSVLMIVYDPTSNIA